MRSLQLAKPHIIVVIGLPGAGKSFFAGKFSDTFSAPYLHYDLYKWRIGDDKVGEEIADHVLDMLLRTKQTIVIEGRGSSAADRQNLVKLARKSGYDTIFVWVQTDPAIARNRATKRGDGAITKKEFDERVAAFETPSSRESYMVISGKHTHATQTKAVLRRLVANRPTNSAIRTSSMKTSRHVPLRGRISG